MDQVMLVPHENLINFPYRSLDFATGARSTAKTCFGPICGMSRPMLRLYKTIEKVAPTDATVLIVGDSGDTSTPRSSASA